MSWKEISEQYVVEKGSAAKEFFDRSSKIVKCNEK